MHAIEHARRLPPGVGKALVQVGLLGVDAPVLFALGRFLQREHGARGAVPVGSQRDAAPAGGVVPAPQPVVVGAARDGEIGDGQIHPARIVFPGEDLFARRRAHAFGDDHCVEAFAASAFEGDGCGIAAGSVFDAGDAVAEAICHMAARGIVEQAGQIAAQDLQFGGRAIATDVFGLEGGDGLAVRVDPGGAFFAGSLGQRGPLQAHALQHLTADTTYIDVLATIAKPGGALRHGDIKAAMGECPGGSVAGDAGAGDEDATRHCSHPGQEISGVILHVLPVTLHVRDQPVHQRDGLLHLVGGKAFQRHCVHTQQCLATEFGNLAPAGGERHQRGAAILRGRGALDELQCLQLVQKRHHGRLLHGRGDDQVALQHRAFPGQQHDRADQRQRHAVRPQSGVDQTVEDPRGMVGQVAWRDRSLRMDEFILIKHLDDRALPWGPSGNVTSPAVRHGGQPRVATRASLAAWRSRRYLLCCRRRHGSMRAGQRPYRPWRAAANAGVDCLVQSPQTGVAGRHLP
ncbi:hypothetical protein XFF6991_420294 [Xanthomonas phaseoli pv. phaseoli]|uniref:Uncharacterized protein n=1 Tax=Xanthomonas campestris pv. phaseoli TaxID=317013 RepID=A0A7Z7J382_XANCH|nr:hypothetical protein XFF6991_420294 [Xanthomonas phaseoli pv. phaseoli]